MSRIGQREKWSHDAARQLLGQPSREPWSEWCPSEPFPSHSAELPGKYIPSSRWPEGAGSWRPSANLTAFILHGVQVVTSTIPPHPSHHQDLLFLLHKISHICLHFCSHLPIPQGRPSSFLFGYQNSFTIVVAYPLLSSAAMLLEGSLKIHKSNHLTPGLSTPSELTLTMDFLIKFRHLTLHDSVALPSLPSPTSSVSTTPCQFPPQLRFYLPQPLWQSPLFLGLCSRCYFG